MTRPRARSVRSGRVVMLDQGITEKAAIWKPCGGGAAIFVSRRGRGTPSARVPEARLNRGKIGSAGNAWTCVGGPPRARAAGRCSRPLVSLRAEPGLRATPASARCAGRPGRRRSAESRPRRGRARRFRCRSRGSRRRWRLRSRPCRRRRESGRRREAITWPSALRMSAPMIWSARDRGHVGGAASPRRRPSRRSARPERAPGRPSPVAGSPGAVAGAAGSAVSVWPAPARPWASRALRAALRGWI